MFEIWPLSIVTTEEALTDLCTHLATQPVLGVDLEGDSLHHYRERVCLIQVSDLTSDYIIDPIKIGDLSPFLDVLAEPSIQKVMHGADYDVVSLKRDYDASIVNLFDTMIAAQFLGYPRFGLMHLIQRHFGIKIDKAYQTHDWSKRPLLTGHVEYARGDTHFLLALREILTWKMTSADLVEAFEEECVLQTQREWNGKRDPTIDFLQVRHSHKLAESGLRILRQLYLERNAIAQEVDLPVFRVLHDDALILLTRSAPESQSDLTRIVKDKFRLNSAYQKRMLAAIQRGMDDDTELPRHPKVRKVRLRPFFERVMNELKVWRNQKVDELDLLPVVVFSNGQLREIARAMPVDAAAFEQVPSIRRWQVKRYGSDILEIIRRYSKQ